MTNEIFPCLWFDGQAKEAAEFYCKVFPNSAIIEELPIVVLFKINGKKIMALNGGPMYKMNPSISMFVHCTSIDECNRIWEALSEGSTVMMPLDKYPWSEHYGWLQDKYGFTWQIMKSDRDEMMPSLMFCNENFGRAQEAMDFYTHVFSDSAITFKNTYPEETPFAGKISYAEFNLNQYPMVAMDAPGEHKFNFSEGISLVVNCHTQSEIDHYWDKFTSDGGAESVCGWCKDKFGLSWQVAPANFGKLLSDPVHGKKAMEAMMKMKKIDIAVMQNA